MFKNHNPVNILWSLTTTVVSDYQMESGTKHPTSLYKAAKVVIAIVHAEGTHSPSHNRITSHLYIIHVTVIRCFYVGLS